MKDIHDITYLGALMSLCIGLPIEISSAYPMFETYDPFALGTIIPLVCLAALFAGLYIPARFKPDPLNGFKLTVLLIFCAFAFAAFMHDINERGFYAMALIWNFAMPGLLWAWQIWKWRRHEAV